MTNEILSMYVAKDMDGKITIWKSKPFRMTKINYTIPTIWWSYDGKVTGIPNLQKMFPDLTWADEPREVCFAYKK